MKNEPGRVAALEVLVNTPGVANLIRQGKIDQLETAMQSGGATGMQTMDSALMALVKSDIISGQEAYQQANNKEKFRAVKEDPDVPERPDDPDDPDDPLDEEFLPALGQ